MKYLVLYQDTKELDLRHYHQAEDDDGRYSTDYALSEGVEVTNSAWKEFDHKNLAIEFARENKGVIVEAFEFDIKKGAK